MKTPLITLALLLSVAFAFVSSTAVAEELVNQNFDAMDVNALPAGWSKAEPANIALVDEAGRGKVLKLSNKDNKYTFLMVALDVAKTAGKPITVSIDAKFPGFYVPIADKLWASPKIVVEAQDFAGKNVLKDGEGDLVPQAQKPNWETYKKTIAIPQGVANVQVQIAIQYVTCELFFDNLLISCPDGPAAPVVAQAQPAPAPLAPANTAAKPGQPVPAAPAPGTAPAPAPADLSKEAT